MIQQRAGGVGVHLLEAAQNFGQSLFAFGRGFRAFHVSLYLRRLLTSRLLTNRILLLAGALVPFCGSLASGFHFDDYAIFQDASILAPNGWLTVWKLTQTRPLTYLTFWLNYRLGGENPWGYHALNLALHAAAVLLLYECLRRVAERGSAFRSADLRCASDSSGGGGLRLGAEYYVGRGLYVCGVAGVDRIA